MLISSQSLLFPCNFYLYPSYLTIFEIIFRTTGLWDLNDMRAKGAFLRILLQPLKKLLSLRNNYIFFYLVLKEQSCDKHFKLFHTHSIKYLKLI